MRLQGHSPPTLSPIRQLPSATKPFCVFYPGKLFMVRFFHWLAGQPRSPLSAVIREFSVWSATYDVWLHVAVGSGANDRPADGARLPSSLL